MVSERKKTLLPPIKDIYEDLEDVPPTLPSYRLPAYVGTEKVVAAAVACMRSKIVRKKRLSCAEARLEKALKEAGLL